MDGTNEDCAQAKKGDHLYFQFADPRTASAVNDKVAVSEIVLTFPLSTGVFWVRTGDKVLRCTKYEYQKQKQLQA